MADLWPHARVEPGRGSAADVLAQFCVVPTAGGVGTALPVHPPRAAAGALCRFSAASTPRAVAQRLALAATLGLTLGVAGPRGVPQTFRVVGDPRGSLEETLAQVFEQPVCFSVAIGTARVNRKRVLEVFDRAGATLGFVKLGGTAVSDADVAAESAALAQIATVQLPGLCVPQVLWSGTWQGVPVLVISALPQSPWQRRTDRRDPPLREIGVLTRAFDQGSAPLTGTGWWPHTTARLTTTRAGGDGRSERALACLDRLGTIAEGRTVAWSAWHGDFTPWNMARHRGGLSVWDWERFAVGVPAGLDTLHYALNTHWSTPHDPRAALAVLRGASLDGWGVGVYLAEILARYLPLRAGAGGDVLTSRTDALLSTWELWGASVLR